MVARELLQLQHFVYIPDRRKKRRSGKGLSQKPSAYILFIRIESHGDLELANLGESGHIVIPNQIRALLVRDLWKTSFSNSI